MKNRLFTSALAALALCSCSQKTNMPSENDSLRFDSSRYSEDALCLPGGRIVNYRSYEQLYYVRNIEDSTYQYLNIYVPEEALASQDAPILMRNYIDSYLASTARRPTINDATARALAEGYIVCIPGARGSNSALDLDDASTLYNGRCPAALCDLKAAVRYLRFNDALIPGNSERIVVDGSGAGAAFAALLGSTGNSPLFAAQLSNMGAAEVRDDVFAAICFSPNTDLQHADMAYEWTFAGLDGSLRPMDESHKALAQECASQFGQYINELAMVNPLNGQTLTADNYADYLKALVLASVQRAVDEGCDIPDDLEVYYNIISEGKASVGEGNAHKIHLTLSTEKESHKEAPREPGKMRKPRRDSNGNLCPRRNDPHAPQLLVELGDLALASDSASKHALPFSSTAVAGDYVMDVNLKAFLANIAKNGSLKAFPAFDSYGVLGGKPTAENKVMGSKDGESANFTQFAASKVNPSANTDEIDNLASLYNPMAFIGKNDVSVAHFWYIRHGSLDTETSLPISINLTTLLQNNDKDVNFVIAWNRQNEGDYNLNDLFSWLKSIK